MWHLTYCSWSHSYGPESNLNVITHLGNRRRQSTLTRRVWVWQSWHSLHTSKNKSSVVLNKVIVGWSWKVMWCWVMKVPSLINFNHVSSLLQSSQSKLLLLEETQNGFIQTFNAQIWTNSVTYSDFVINRFFFLVFFPPKFCWWLYKYIY